MVYKNQQEKISSKLKSIHRYLNRYRNKSFKNISLEQQNISLQKIIKILHSDLLIEKQKVLQQSTNKNSLEKVYNRIFDELVNLGPPFVKSKRDAKYLTYIKAITFIEKYFKKHRNNIIDIFKLGQEYFKSTNFVFHPKKITINQFFLYDLRTMSEMPKLQKLGVRSWFNEFAKGREYIDLHYIKLQKDRHPLLTKSLIDIWNRYKNQNECSIWDHNDLIKITRQAYVFSGLNKLSTRTTFDCIDKFLNNNQGESERKINSPKLILSDWFWKQKIIELLIEFNIFKNKKDIVTKI